MALTSRVVRLVRRIERMEALDRVAAPLQHLVSSAVRPRVVRNTLSGTNLGHPLHPMLTDVPIGLWTASAVADLFERRGERTADLLVATGIVAAVPTALSGVNDWSDTYGGETRVGLAHATANTTALLLYCASFAARKLGRRGLGRGLGFGGFAAVAVGGYLGGYLSFVKGVNVNRTAYEQRPTEWMSVYAEQDLAEGSTVKADAAGASVMLHRSDGRIYALASTCTHMGGPLAEGTFADGCVTCPWHGSTFRLDDGTIVRGPASTRQPTYETRIADGRIEVRAIPE
jgi:nitrite reductase/ring-hydroxylating ferredoxin subunit/uncharacterized membrane protein